MEEKNKISMYGSNFNLHTGLHDFVLNFEELDMSGINTGETPIKTECSIVVVPSQLKQIQHIINQQLEMYESNIASIADINQDTISRLEQKGFDTNEPSKSK